MFRVPVKVDLTSSRSPKYVDTAKATANFPISLLFLFFSLALKTCSEDLNFDGDTPVQILNLILVAGMGSIHLVAGMDSIHLVAGKGEWVLVVERVVEKIEDAGKNPCERQTDLPSVNTFLNTLVQVLPSQLEAMMDMEKVMVTD